MNNTFPYKDDTWSLTSNELKLRIKQIKILKQHGFTHITVESPNHFEKYTIDKALEHYKILKHEMCEDEHHDDCNTCKTELV